MPRGAESEAAMRLAPGQEPLYEIKANLFKALAHPARIRALELIRDAPGGSATVAYLLERINIESSHLSQHLRVLRRHGVVVSERRASNVVYTLAHPGVADLLGIARGFLLDGLEEGDAQRAARLLGPGAAEPPATLRDDAGAPEAARAGTVDAGGQP